MSRCKVCDRLYDMSFFSQFPDENYCHTCEREILICLMEMEEIDGYENEHQ